VSQKEGKRLDKIFVGQKKTAASGQEKGKGQWLEQGHAGKELTDIFTGERWLAVHRGEKVTRLKEKAWQFSFTREEVRKTSARKNVARR